MSERDKRRREELSDALRRHGLRLAHASEWWPQHEGVPEHYRDWDPLVHRLLEECEAGGGPITACYVDGLLRIAARAIPAIDDLELGATVASAGTHASIGPLISAATCGLTGRRPHKPRTHGSAPILPSHQRLVSNAPSFHVLPNTSHKHSRKTIRDRAPARMASLAASSTYACKSTARELFRGGR